MFRPLETERLILKNIGSDDRAFILDMFSDDAVNKYLFDAEPLQNLEEADEIIDFYIQSEPRNQHRWIISRKEDNLKIGTCGFHCWDTNQSIVEIGYDLKKAFHGNGYMTEALQELIEFASNEMEVKTINACIYKENVNSIKLVQKFGFIMTGTKNETFRGEQYIHHIYSLQR